MLEKVDLSRKLTKEEHRKIIPELRERLRTLQYECKNAKIPVIIVFEGWDAAGKGLMISRLLERIDPRGFTVYPSQPPTEEEKNKPFFWRYWTRLPGYGEMVLFDRSWYGRVLIERVAKIVPKKVWQRAFEEIQQFERQVADDGAVFAKFWLHISKAEQHKRLKKMEEDKFERWRISEWDWWNHKHYDDYVVAVEEMIARTDTPEGPWTIVEATDRRWAEFRVFDTLVRAMEEALNHRKQKEAVHAQHS